MYWPCTTEKPPFDPIQDWIHVIFYYKKTQYQYLPITRGNIPNIYQLFGAMFFKTFVR
jgi:hypothetical protein